MAHMVMGFKRKGGRWNVDERGREGFMHLIYLIEQINILWSNMVNIW